MNECHQVKSSLWIHSDALDLVLAIAIPGNEQYFADLAPGLDAGLLVNEDHQIHRLSDQILLRSARGLGYEAFEPDQTAHGIVGVDCRRTAGMPGIPSFEQGVRLRTTNLAHDDSSRLQPHAGA